jgi:hypothetical protein
MIKAIVNKTPPSLLTTIPNLVKCNKIALVIVPKPIIETNKVILEIKIDAINSIIPEPILPKCSKPKFQNINTFWGTCKFKI